MILVKITPAMSERFFRLLIKLDNETKFMMLEPDERSITPEQLSTRLNIHDNDGVYLGVQAGDELVGFINAERGTYKRIRHSAYIVIGILNAYSGQGIGKLLFREMENWAEQHEISRLELTVMTHNIRAIKLYEHMGFVKEGIKQKSMLVDGKYIDEYYMTKLL